MSKKSAKIAALMAACEAREPGLDPHYVTYFECFNRGLYYEAHDVLEELWLEDRRGPDGDFYKALIQLAGAFVHLQKDGPRYPRLRPGAALLRLSAGYLSLYEPVHRRLDVAAVRRLAFDWERELVDGKFVINPLPRRVPPRLDLRPEEGSTGA